MDQLEKEAKSRLDPMTYAYYRGGAEAEATLADNVAAWSRIRVLPRVLRDVSQVSTETVVLGARLDHPVIVAPTAFHRLAHEEGEAATARAAAAAGTLMCVSTIATVSLEDVAAAAPESPRWFQLYVHRDRVFTEELVHRAGAAGYLALVLTVDTAAHGARWGEDAVAFSLPDGIDMANVPGGLPDVEGSGLGAYITSALDPALTFDDIGWLTGVADIPVLVKGVLRADDTMAALDAGASGIVVSNHGGRQLDTASATADALPAVVDAVDGRAPVLVDGGIRTGTDVVKALALGAVAVLVGRPILWGLATGERMG